jgi:hypothetical protein
MRQVFHRGDLSFLIGGKNEKKSICLDIFHIDD